MLGIFLTINRDYFTTQHGLTVFNMDNYTGNVHTT